MKNVKLYWMILVIVLGIAISYRIVNWINTSSQISAEKQEGYWTCPMHPQIHQDHSGNCPICGMPLIKVDSKGKPEVNTSIDISERQKQVISFQKYIVQKKNINFKLPVSGRVSGSGTVVFYVYESDLKDVKVGLQFEGRDKVSSEYEIKGNIISVDNIVDPTSRTVRTVGEIKDRKQKLFAETTVTANILVNKTNVIVIPESAVLHTGRNDLVYVIDAENKITPRSVTVGLKSEGFYEITSGLQVGESINAGANFLLDSESKIRGVQE